MNTSSDRTVKTQCPNERYHHAYSFLRHGANEPHLCLTGTEHQRLVGVDNTHTVCTYSFPAERPKRPPGAQWPATLTGSVLCASPSGTSVSLPPQSQHPLTGPWSDRLQNSKDAGNQTRLPPFPGSLAFSPQILVTVHHNSNYGPI